MNTRVICIIAMLFAASPCFSQDAVDPGPSPTIHSIGLTIGINQLKEANLLSRAHSGFITTLSYGRIRSDGVYRDLQFMIGYSRIIAQSEDVTKSANILLGASWAYAPKLIEGNSWRWFLGPQVRLAYSVGAYPNWDDSHLYWANSLSAGINNVLIYPFADETQLVSHVSIPLVSLFSRPDPLRLTKFDDLSFSGIVKSLHSNMDVGFWNTAFQVHFDAEYQFPIFRTKKEAFFYSLDYVGLRNSEGNPFIQLLHQFGMKVFL
jgi:hypothetical protein